MSCGVHHRRGLDPTLLWLWCRLVPIALIRPLAWEHPYAMSVDPKKKKKKRQKKKMFTVGSSTETDSVALVAEG